MRITKTDGTIEYWIDMQDKVRIARLKKESVELRKILKHIRAENKKCKRRPEINKSVRKCMDKVYGK